MQIQVFQASDDAASGWQMLHLGKLQTAPKILYTSSRADSSFIDHLQRQFEAFGDSTDADELLLITPQVRLEKAATFSYEQVALVLRYGPLFTQSLPSSCYHPATAVAWAKVDIMHKNRIFLNFKASKLSSSNSSMAADYYDLKAWLALINSALQAWHSLEQLHIIGQAEGLGSKDRMQSLNTKMDLSATQQVEWSSHSNRL